MRLRGGLPPRNEGAAPACAGVSYRYRQLEAALRGSEVLAICTVASVGLPAIANDSPYFDRVRAVADHQRFRGEPGDKVQLLARPWLPSRIAFGANCRRLAICIGGR